MSSPIHARRLSEAWGGPKQHVIPGGRHTALENDAYWQGVRAFLAARALSRPALSGPSPHHS